MWSRMVVTGDGGSKCVGALWSRAEARRRISGQVHTRLLTFFLFSFSWFCNCFFFFFACAPVWPAETRKARNKIQKQDSSTQTPGS